MVRDDIFIICNVNVAMRLHRLKEYAACDMNERTPLGWCINRISELTSEQIEEALRAFSVLDFMYDSNEILHGFTDPLSDIWDITVNATEAPFAREVAAVAIAGRGIGRAGHAVATLAFSVLEEIEYESKILAMFDNVPLKEARKRGGRVKSERRDGPLKLMCIQWATKELDVIPDSDSLPNKRQLTDLTMTNYHNWVRLHPPESSGYEKLHPRNKKGRYRAELNWRTTYGWVAHLVDGTNKYKK